MVFLHLLKYGIDRIDNKLDINEYDEEIGLKLKELGRKKGYLSKSKA